MRGWELQVPPNEVGVRERTRPELLRLLGELTSLIQAIERIERGDGEREPLVSKLPFLRRLACKVKYRLSTYKSVYQPGCRCKTTSESCVGLVVGVRLFDIPDIFCQFTGRTVPVVILACSDVPAPWLKLKHQLLERVKARGSGGDVAHREKPLTYTHITQHHLPAIKCLLENYFWSNIDVSGVVQYSEFSCAVLYDKLLVGFGYLTPGTHPNEGYINFLFVRPHWRRCGIARSILYFLRQQCLYWTLTLHVSPDSAALSLYHKFGFKVVSRIRNFYGDFVLSNSQSDYDALFMRLDSKTPQFF